MKVFIFLAAVVLVHGAKRPIPFPNKIVPRYMYDIRAAQARWDLIFPGTKWCGSGDIADNYEDLGIHSDTDKCCRTHDFCTDYILAGETKYNLTNDSFHTKLHCSCDDALYRCLKKVDSFTSGQVGTLYFDLIGTQCYRKDYPARCVEYDYFPRFKCIKYKYDTTKSKLYQWFDVDQY